MSHNLDSARNTSAINLSGLHRQSLNARNNNKEAHHSVDTYAISEQQMEDVLPLGVFLYKNYRLAVLLCSFNIFFAVVICAKMGYYYRVHKSFHNINPALMNNSN